MTTLGRLLILTMFALTGLGGPVWAQSTSVPPALLDEIAGVDLVSLRAQDLLAHGAEDARDLLGAMNQREQVVRARIDELRAAVEIKKREIDNTRTEKDLADKQKREDEKRRFELRERLQDREKRLLERQRDAAEAKLQFFGAQRALMGAQITAFDREGQLNELVAQLSTVTQAAGAEVGRARMRAEVRELERETLLAMEEMANREKQAADRRQLFIRRQLEVVRARADLNTLLP